MLGRKPAAVAVENLLFDLGIELMVAPGGHDEFARARFVVLLYIDRGESGLASASLRRRGAEERLDLVGVRVAKEESGLRLLAQFVLPRPVGMREPELLDRLGLPARLAVPVLVPEGKVAGRRVLDARSRACAGTQDFPEIGLVRGADLVRTGSASGSMGSRAQAAPRRWPAELCL